MNANTTPQEVATAYAALRADRRCEYIGGGRIRVQSTNVGFALSPSRTITVPKARAAIAAASSAQRTVSDDSAVRVPATPKA